MEHLSSAPITIIPLYGTEELSQKVTYYLKEIYNDNTCKVIESKIIRFSTGDAKAELQHTVRGSDVYILMDVGNYSCNYYIHGQKVLMSPDEHFQNLKRTISAIAGKASRINVISPMLYSSRQDRRVSRESLDCAVALRELEAINVSNIMAFDVHDNRVQNAVPFMGFDDLFPMYQVIKSLKRNFPDIIFDENNTILISPDLGATNRNFRYASALDLDMGIFYKRRSRSKMVDGSYVLEEHKYMGPDIEGKDVIIVDDIINSGNTILDVVNKMHEKKAKRIFVVSTFAIFSNGTSEFNKAYEEGKINAVFITNASYLSDQVRKAPWFREVDITKYMAYYIYCINTGKSISKLLDPHEKIQKLLNM